MTVDDLVTALVGALVGGGGLGTLLLARERRRGASEARIETAEIASESEFRAYLREQIALAEERHAREIEQRDAQHSELMAVLQTTREAHTAAEHRAARAEERVAELEREVAELREWRRSIEARTPTASPMAVDWISRAPVR